MNFEIEPFQKLHFPDQAYCIELGAMLFPQQFIENLDAPLKLCKSFHRHIDKHFVARIYINFLIATHITINFHFAFVLTNTLKQSSACLSYDFIHCFRCVVVYISR